MSDITRFIGGCVFDGQQLLDNHCAVFEGQQWVDICTLDQRELTGRVVDLQGDIISPGYTDLQVNGGGGVMLNDGPSVETLAVIAKAHRSLGTMALLPTLITDSVELTKAALSAVQRAIAEGVHGIAGLHLEGPHLSVAKKGAHDEALIRPMNADDLAMLLNAADELPVLMMTVAPENVTLEQVHVLSKAGVIVSLGHTNASYDTCVAYHNAGASCATHLYNAMSQLDSREPGLVGTFMDCENLSAGLIADGVHVHPAAIRAAWQNNNRKERVYLVSDAMAIAGTTLTNFALNGRAIHRKDSRLTLADGTLAGADLDITGAIRFMHHEVGIELSAALRAAITVPNNIIAMRTDAIGSPIGNVIRIDEKLTCAKPLVTL